MMDVKKSKHNDDIVFTGIGMITAAGYGFQESLKALDQPPTRSTFADYQVKGFNPAPYLTDRKVVKVVSRRDVLGLVAFEECVKSGHVRHEAMNPDRTGLYVGAPPSATTDNVNYAEAIEATRNTYGELVEAEFGLTFRNASPTTLLSGLPNNVLCYGSKTLDARGTNSNYTALETSAHLSILGAARAMRLGRLDCAIAGGFSAHTDEVSITTFRRRGLLKKTEGQQTPFSVTPFGPSETAGTITADGAAFVSMERRGAARERKANVFATLLSGATASDAQWPFSAAHSDATLKELITDAMSKAGVTAADIDLVAVSGSGIAAIDSVEQSAIVGVLSAQGLIPTLICTTPVWGNLMEAGGIGEIGVMARICAKGHRPQALAVDVGVSQRSISPRENQIGIILRTSAMNEYTCLVIRFEGEVNLPPQ